MKDEAARHGRPATPDEPTAATVPRQRVIARVREIVSAIVRLREAIADGEDHYCIEAVLEGMEVDCASFAAELESPALICGNCGLRFEWPGQLRDHLRWVHPYEPWRRASRSEMA